MSNVGVVPTKPGGVTVPEAARRLRLRIADVYELVFSGQLAGEPGRNGDVLIAIAELDRYERRAARRTGQK